MVAVLDTYSRHINAGQARLAKLLGLPIEVEAEGSYVYDQDGQRYLDCGGFGVFTLGHRPATVVDAVARQLQRQPLSTHLFLNPVLAQAVEALAAVVPRGLERITFANSGAEAVELGLKIGRSLGHRRVIAMDNGFHGKTLGALSVTARRRYREPFEPLLPDVTHIPFGDAEALQAALAAGPAATVILEPVQAEGGVRIPPVGYLAAVQQACRAAGALLVVDEIQTGLGRLGTWWGVDVEGVTPDVLLTGKALGGGVLPVSAVASTTAAYARLDPEPLLHSSTFAGNPLAAAAVVATLDFMRQHDVPRRAAELGERLLLGLREALGQSPDIVADVRGRGLMIGIEFRREHHGAEFLQDMLNQHVIVCYSLNSDRVVRVMPSIQLSPSDCDWLFEATATVVRGLKA